MESIYIKDFRFGLDKRKSELTQRPGTLEEFQNGFVNQGGEIENRKAFVRTARPANTFGLQATSDGWMTFGSVTTPGSFPLNIGSVGSPMLVQYQRLQHPSVLDGMASDTVAMTAVNYSESFGGKAFVIATFADGRTFAFYDGAAVEDFTAGLVLPYLAGHNDRIASHLVRIINETANYTAAIVAGVGNEHKLDVTGPIGVDYELTTDKTTVAGTFVGPTKTQDPVAPVTGVSATGSFRIRGGSAAGVATASATGSITRDGTNPTATDTITIGQKVYRFVNTLTLEGDVKIGATSADTLTNLKNAINHGGTPNTDYRVARAHPWVTAGTIAGTVLPLTAMAGASGNSVALAENVTPAGWVVSGATMTGGAGNCVSSVRVVAPAETYLELMGQAVSYTTSNQLTATAVANEINSNTASGLNHGYTATVDDDRVRIFAPTTASPVPNNYVTQVSCGGDVCIGDCMFYFTQLTTSGFMINSILVNTSTNLITATAFPGAFGTLSAYYADLESQINNGSGVHGIIAYAATDFMQLSKVTTRSDDAALPVYITPAAANTVGIVFGTPPANPIPLVVSVPTRLSDVINVADTLGVGPFAGSRVFSFGNEVYTGTTVATVDATGGSGLYSTFLWRAAFTGSDSAIVKEAFGTFDVEFKIKPIATNRSQTLFTIQIVDTGTFTFKIPTVPISGQFVCEVVDSLGNKTVSPVMVVTFVFA